MLSNDEVSWNSGDSDDAPEEVNLKESKDVFDQLKRKTSEVQKDAQRKRKQRNKQKDLTYKAQKEAKLARLESMKLPDEVLNDIPSDDEDGEKSTEPQQFAGIHTEFQSDDDEGNDETDSGFDSSLSGKVSVRLVQELKTKSFQAALDFKQKKMAGCRLNVQRQSGTDRRMLREKKLAFRKTCTR